VRSSHVLAAVVLAACASASSRAETPTAKPEQLILLGTAAGPLPQAGRAQPANAIVVGDDTYLFDVGNGVLQQLVKAGRRFPTLRTIFITHHHLDHNADLGTILGVRYIQSRTKPLTVVGPFGVNQLLSGWKTYFQPMLAAGLDPNLAAIDPLAGVTVSEIGAPGLVYQDENIKVTAAENAHYHFAPDSEQPKIAKSYAYRVETPSRTIVFTGDTGPSDAVAKLAKGADILVSEVQDPANIDRIMSIAFAKAPEAQRRNVEEHLRSDHMTPEDVGRLATAAAVKTVLLTHISETFGAPEDLSVLTDGVRKNFNGEIVLGTDLMQK
jgi:ribonuclease BN (tRNA processing enzyme)